MGDVEDPYDHNNPQYVSTRRKLNLPTKYNTLADPTTTDIDQPVMDPSKITAAAPGVAHVQVVVPPQPNIGYSPPPSAVPTPSI
jgi:hypothetical protein